MKDELISLRILSAVIIAGVILALAGPIGGPKPVTAALAPAAVSTPSE